MTEFNSDDCKQVNTENYLYYTELSSVNTPGRSFTDKFLPVKMRFIVPNWVSNSDNESLNLNIIILRH